MEIKTRKYFTISEDNIESISLSLATKEDVLEWTNGEITKPETINYKSYKPERDGLFCEVIFGPQIDYKCPVCGYKYKRSNEGQICEKTEKCRAYQPTILSKATRRSRMGHIALASPVVHYWFFKIDHSIIAKALNLKAKKSTKAYSRNEFESLIYFKSHIVLESGDVKALPKNEIIKVDVAPNIYLNALLEIQGRYEEGSPAYEELGDKIVELKEIATSKIGQDYGIDFYDLNDIIHEYSEAKIGTGAEAIEYLLNSIDVEKEIRSVRREISKINRDLKVAAKPENKISQRSKLYKRLQVLNAFSNSKQEFTSMLIYNLPVIPADLRPLVQIDGGRHSTTDVNELYRRIIIRNNRLKKWKETHAPILIIQNELRMLQEAVDALIDNSRKKFGVVTAKDNIRPLKSIADSLTGKKGRFRQNLLGKRVDYSGRSVIVVGPELKMHQAGIPRLMATRLFEPWIIKELIDNEITNSTKAAKKLIEDQNSKIWPYVEKTIKGKVILLNRAPTLHRLSIQAFEPILVRGKAIRLHPLVTTAFNADFDGDQMAVHVPTSRKAIIEAKELMYANKNILGPKDGEPIINPSQDMIIGLYYLTMEDKDAKGSGNFYYSLDDMKKAYELGKISLHARCFLPISAINKTYIDDKKGYVLSTVGKFIFNSNLPESFPFVFNNSSKTLKQSYNEFFFKYGVSPQEILAKTPINEPLTKKNIAVILRNVFDRYVSLISKKDVASVVRKVHGGNSTETMTDFAKLIKQPSNSKLTIIHSQILSSLIAKHYNEIKIALTRSNENVEPIFEIENKVDLLEKVWFDYTNLVASVLDNIKNLGFEFSTKSGLTMSIGDIIPSSIKKGKIKEGEKYVKELEKQYYDGLLTDDERYQLVIKKWGDVKEEILQDLQEITNENYRNPIFTMMNSGARSNIDNIVQLAGLRGLMANNKKQNVALTNNNIAVRSTVEVPVKSSFLDGLTAYEFYSSTHGARKGLTDVALNTANSGYLTRRLVDLAQNIVVKEDDCHSDVGTKVKNIIDTKTNSVIVPMKERLIGRFSNQDVLDKKGNKIVERNQIITSEIADEIEAAGHESIEIRSVFWCQTGNGVCRKCYGNDLSNNKLVEIGEPVGIIAAQSIGEPGTQLTMRTFHTGGVAGVQDITGGFDRLKQLIDATKQLWEDKAIIAEAKGQVIEVRQKKATPNTKAALSEIVVKYDNEDENKVYPFRSARRMRAKANDYVIAGQKLVDGPIILDELLKTAGIIPLQSYLLKEIQRLYHMQGILISDKYIEIIIRQMLSKVVIKDSGDSSFFVGSLVSIHHYRDESTRLLKKGKKPPFGIVVIKGAKQIPLLSDSFLAAASYQETAKVLVHASISSQNDLLQGLKENIIVGHKIPAGTGSKFEPNGKYDLDFPEVYFE